MDKTCALSSIRKQSRGIKLLGSGSETKHRLIVASSTWGCMYCLPIGNRDDLCRNSKGTVGLGQKNCNSTKWVKEQIVSSQTQVWIHRVAPKRSKSKFTEIRYIKVLGFKSGTKHRRIVAGP